MFVFSVFGQSGISRIFLTNTNGFRLEVNGSEVDASSKTSERFRFNAADFQRWK